MNLNPRIGGKFRQSILSNHLNQDHLKRLPKGGLAGASDKKYPVLNTYPQCFKTFHKGLAFVFLQDGIHQTGSISFEVPFQWKYFIFGLFLRLNCELNIHQFLFLNNC